MRSTAAVLVAALIVAMIVFGPLLLIWALNTLFMFSIPYTLKTWAAALVLGGVVGSSGSRSSGK